ncbi:MAG: DNA polymerase III subunit delta' [Zetaproteobacteria bacterium]|nr:MAG: DNA polymerase III subunit delta' [Zetaproteobacteria bacterium]
MSLVGHEAVVRRFAQALDSGRLHHAWLLYGRAGVGKFVLARHLAQRYLCARRKACGECHACRMFQAGAHPDALVVAPEEGKRDLSIAQVRALCAFLALSGGESERRVVIIDRAARMNAQAANALLKMLEEPSPGSLLLIVCDELQRLPATIRSRCMLTACAPLDDAQTAKVLQAEGIAAAHLAMATALAEGCPGRVACLRDASTAEALLAWQRLTRDATTADIGAVERWLQRHARTVPHALIAEVVVRAHQSCLLRALSAQARQVIDKALLDLARWPHEVQQHGLRVAASFLALFLALRQALRAAA